jgi:hypothetical protein
MVAANKNLLKVVRKLAIRDELLAMRLRGRLVVCEGSGGARPVGSGRRSRISQMDG